MTGGSPSAGRSYLWASKNSCRKTRQNPSSFRKATEKTLKKLTLSQRPEFSFVKEMEVLTLMTDWNTPKTWECKCVPMSTANGFVFSSNRDHPHTLVEGRGRNSLSAGREPKAPGLPCLPINVSLVFWMLLFRISAKKGIAWVGERCAWLLKNIDTLIAFEGFYLWLSERFSRNSWDERLHAALDPAANSPVVSIPLSFMVEKAAENFRFTKKSQPAKIWSTTSYGFATAYGTRHFGHNQRKFIADWSLDFESIVHG